MKTFFTTVVALAGAATSRALPTSKRDGGVSVTPHDAYSSSVGVLGCKIDTNRVAYFPSFPSCDGMCYKVSANGRSVNLLHVDSSGGAYDISYDAWNYLKTGKSATEDPQAGGGIAATYQKVDMSECSNLIKEPSGKLAFSAANSVNFVTSCSTGGSSNSWISKNSVLVNIANPTCNYGVDEVCKMPPLSEGNQPVCPTSKLGIKTPLKSDPVYNIEYPSGKKSLAVIS